MKSPKTLFHQNPADVKWLADLVDDERFQRVLLMVEMNIHNQMANLNGPNQMMIDNAIRIGLHRFRAELMSFATPNSAPQKWNMPPTLHDPDAPVPRNQ